MYSTATFCPAQAGQGVSATNDKQASGKGRKGGEMNAMFRFVIR